MSWDFYMIPSSPEPCPTCGHRDEGDETLRANYTYNVSPMFYEAFGNLLVGFDGKRLGIRGLNGKTGRDAAPFLRAAIEAMETDPATYEAMNPENGWGSYGGALQLLKKLNGWCSRHPNAVLEVSG